jgi:hypothetical protein
MEAVQNAQLRVQLQTQPVSEEPGKIFIINYEFESAFGILRVPETI